MNQQRCKESLAKMAVTCPDECSVFVNVLAAAVDGCSVPARKLVSAIEYLRAEGIDMEEFLAAYSELLEYFTTGQASGRLAECLPHSPVFTPIAPETIFEILDCRPLIFRTFVRIILPENGRISPSRQGVARGLAEAEKAISSPEISGYPLSR